MPYIRQEDRIRLDKIVNTMVDMEIEADGDLNYVLFKYCKEQIKPSYWYIIFGKKFKK